MLMQATISLVALIGVLCATLNGAGALDETKYPDWKGQWVRADSAEIAPWDSRKPGGLAQPPLTPEHQAGFEANLKQLAAGVKASDPTARRARRRALVRLGLVRIGLVRIGLVRIGLATVGGCVSSPP